MTDASGLSGPSFLQMLLGLYGFLLPLLLYVVWSSLALWDIGKRRELGAAAVWGWVLAIFALPIIGAAAYLLAGSGQISKPLKLATVGGGIAAYALVLVLGSAIGGIS